jgi:hypothetical protein
VLSSANQVFATVSVLSAANQVFAAELCCPHRIRFSLLNCIVRSKSGVRCQIVNSAANQVFDAEFVSSAANQVFAAELCILQRIKCSLPNLCCPQRIRFSLPNYVVRSESGFVVVAVLSAVNLRLLPKLCCLQQKCNNPNFNISLSVNLSPNKR